MARLTINGKTHIFDVHPDTPLLWAIREQVGLTGTKYGCGIAQCGSCTVHIDGAPVRSCVMSVAAAEGKQIRPSSFRCQRRFRCAERLAGHDVPQCGYCQSGMIMAVSALLKTNQADRRGYRRRDYQHLPLWHFPAGPRGDSRRGQGIRGSHELRTESLPPLVHHQQRRRRRRACARAEHPVRARRCTRR